MTPPKFKTVAQLWNKYVQAFKMGPTFQWRMFHERTCKCPWCADYWLRMKGGPEQKMTLKSPFTKREIMEFGTGELAKLEADPDLTCWIETDCQSPSSGLELDLGWKPRTGTTYVRPRGEPDAITSLGSLGNKELISCLLDAARRFRPDEIERKADAKEV